MNPVTALVRRHPLISFVALAYGLTWGIGALLRGELTGLLSTNGLFTGAPTVRHCSSRRW